MASFDIQYSLIAGFPDSPQSIHLSSSFGSPGSPPLTPLTIRESSPKRAKVLLSPSGSPKSPPPTRRSSLERPFDEFTEELDHELLTRIKHWPMQEQCETLEALFKLLQRKGGCSAKSNR